ncbi:MAG: hypothetical protein ACI9BF_000620 [Candidatus Paceibacteria bacterium]|jgi:hypothetical protein
MAKEFMVNLPPVHSGYVRSLRTDEIEKVGDSSARIGYFSSTGKFVYWNDEMDALLAFVAKKGLVAHQVS